MQIPATESPMQDAPDFAGLFAALAAPTRKRESRWKDEDLAEDVATLSYESALRAHARYRPTDRLDDCVLDRADKASTFAAGLLSSAPKGASSKDPKSASITIRMSKAECDQLHRRAAEAGLTLSAYLRSCTLEAEELRAQVKQALAEMRKAGTEEPRDQENQQTKTLMNEAAPERANKSEGYPEEDHQQQQTLARSRLGRVLLPIRRLGTRFLQRSSS